MANWLPAQGKKPLLEWWEVVKVDVKAAAKEITKERKNERKQEVSFLTTLHLQAHLACRVSSGELRSLPNSDLLKRGPRLGWVKDVFLHRNLQEVQESEHTLIYHHKKLQSNRKRSSILKLKNNKVSL